jgi:hypothetical protein
MRVDDEQVRETAYGTGGFFPPSELTRALALDLLEARAIIAKLVYEFEYDAIAGGDMSSYRTCVVCGAQDKYGCSSHAPPFVHGDVDLGDGLGKVPCPFGKDDRTFKEKLAALQGFMRSQGASECCVQLMTQAGEDIRRIQEGGA